MIDIDYYWLLLIICLSVSYAWFFLKRVAKWTIFLLHSVKVWGLCGTPKLPFECPLGPHPFWHCSQLHQKALRSFRPCYLAPYFRTRNVIIAACLFWFVAWRTRNITFEAHQMTREKGGEGTGAKWPFTIRSIQTNSGTSLKIGCLPFKLEKNSLPKISSLCINPSQKKSSKMEIADLSYSGRKTPSRTGI